MDNSTVVMIIRNMEWDKAKGSLQAILSTFYGERNSSEDWTKFKDCMDKFIEEVENEIIC